MLYGYMRVSTRDNRQSVDLQHDALLAAGVDHRNLFKDEVTGAATERPGLTRCLATLEAGDTLIVWRIDRLGRSLAHLIEIINSLKARRVSFKSIMDPIDTTTAQGEFLLAIFGALAQYERAMISERVKAGVDAARSRGRKGGRPRSIDDATLESIVRALDAGATKPHVCKTFSVSRTTLNDSLSRIGWTSPAIAAPAHVAASEGPAQ